MIEEGYQCAFVVCDDEVIATGAPPTFGVLVMRAIRDVTGKPITRVASPGALPSAIPPIELRCAMIASAVT